MFLSPFCAPYTLMGTLYPTFPPNLFSLVLVLLLLLLLLLSLYFYLLSFLLFFPFPLTIYSAPPKHLPLPKKKNQKKNQ